MRKQHNDTARTRGFDHAPARSERARETVPAARREPAEEVQLQLDAAEQALAAITAVSMPKLAAAQATEADRRPARERRAAYDTAWDSIDKELASVATARKLAAVYATRHHVDATAMLEAFDQKVTEARKSFTTAPPAPARFERVPGEEDIAAAIAMPIGPERNTALVVLFSQLDRAHALVLARRLEHPDDEDKLAKAFKLVVDVRADLLGILAGTRKVRIDPRKVQIPPRSAVELDPRGGVCERDGRGAAPRRATAPVAPLAPPDATRLRAGQQPPGNWAAPATPRPKSQVDVLVDRVKVELPALESQVLSDEGRLDGERRVAAALAELDALHAVLTKAQLAVIDRARALVPPPAPAPAMPLHPPPSGELLPESLAEQLSHVSALVRQTVQDIDDDASGARLWADAQANPSGLALMRWALELQSVPRSGGENYLRAWYLQLHAWDAAKVQALGQQIADMGVEFGVTAGRFTSLEHVDPKEPLPPALAPDLAAAPLSRGVEEFASVHYDISYRYMPGRLSTILQLVYPDGARLDLDLYLISDNAEPAPFQAFARSYIGPAERVFPLRLDRQTTPRLWAAKQAALAAMVNENLQFENLVSIGLAGVMSNLPIGPVGAPEPAVPSRGSTGRGPTVLIEPPPVKVEPPPVKVEPPPVKVEPPPVKVEPPPVTKLDAEMLIVRSEGRPGPGTNIGHAEDHIPSVTASDADAKALAQSRPTKINTTVFRSRRHAVQVLRDVMNHNRAAINALPPDGTTAAGGTYPVTPESVPGFNARLGQPATPVEIGAVTWRIVRLPSGELHLLHFAPSVK